MNRGKETTRNCLSRDLFEQETERSSHEDGRISTINQQISGIVLRWPLSLFFLNVQWLNLRLRRWRPTAMLPSREVACPWKTTCMSCQA